MVKILAIEDDPQVLDNIFDILELEDYDIVTANNGRRGVEVALKERPDLVICDVMMPHMNGYEVLQALREQQATKTVPFIFLTAKADRADLRHGMELGADDYLTKPFTPQELLQALLTRLAKQKELTQHSSEQIQAITRQLNNRLYIDPITGLPNRLTLRKQFLNLVQAYRQAAKGTKILGIASLRVDRFESIRRDLGYQQGDRLLQSFAGCLRDSFADEFVAQIDNRDYVVLFRPVPHKRELLDPILALRDRLSNPFTLEEKKIFLSISAGIALFPRDGNNIATLTSNAETAMVRVAEHQGDTYEFYSSIKHQITAPKLDLEADLREAIAREQLEIHYQPQIEATTQTIASCEAVLRWQHPDRGLIPPAEFVPLAEEVGLLSRISEYILERACDRVVGWQKEFAQPLRLAVNISNQQFEQAQMRHRIAKILSNSGLKPEDLELEFAENFLIQDVAIAQRNLDAFRHLGVRLAIDNFGTGYSSLQYLQKFKVDTLKIDRCFIRGIERNGSNGAIVQAILEMSHHLGLRVVAEGVATKAEAIYLQQNHCDFLQGSYYSAPVSAIHFSSKLKSLAI
ncbi:MAG: EAL domain-containing protein [Cyanobacteria bacterium SBLK]|nr:EAL domain-containing protein [Cyanobacteria bacterium SBLK]